MRVRLLVVAVALALVAPMLLIAPTLAQDREVAGTVESAPQLPSEHPDILAQTQTVVEVDYPDPERPDDCTQDGWLEAGFANQGQCMRYLQTGKDSR